MLTTGITGEGAAPATDLGITAAGAATSLRRRPFSPSWRSRCCSVRCRPPGWRRSGLFPSGAVGPDLAGEMAIPEVTWRRPGRHIGDALGVRRDATHRSVRGGPLTDADKEVRRLTVARAEVDPSAAEEAAEGVVVPCSPCPRPNADAECRRATEVPDMDPHVDGRIDRQQGEDASDEGRVLCFATASNRQAREVRRQGAAGR